MKTLGKIYFFGFSERARKHNTNRHRAFSFLLFLGQSKIHLNLETILIQPFSENPGVYPGWVEYWLKGHILQLRKNFI